MGKKYIVGGTFIIYCRQLAEEQTQKEICSVLILQRMKKLETESHFGLVNPCIKLNGYTEQEITKSLELSKEFYLNLYCYCYRKDWFDRHLNNAEKGIRFIDPNYKELFRIEDGDKIRYFTNSGEPRHLICRYIDDYHFEATSDRGKNLYHICEFAEQYQNQGCHGIIPLRQSLPESCFSTLGTTGELIVITKGEKGYSPTDVYPQNTSPKEGAAALNAANGVTKAQEAAMVAGSMFGWETPAANPKNYDALGQPLKNQRRSHAAER